jgi:hypothetical protein
LRFGNEIVTFSLVPWDVVYTERAADWIVALGEGDFQRIMAAIEMLEQRGPGLGRPLVDRIEGSRHHNMKGAAHGNRPLAVRLRRQPPRRVILLGGDKRGDWSGWYERNIPLADDLYDAYLREET